MPAKNRKSAPVKLDETQLDAAVGGATISTVTIADPCTKVARVFIGDPCSKVVRTL